MPRIDACLVAEWKQHGPNRSDEGRIVATGKVGSTDGASEKRIAHEQVRPALAWSSHLEADTARTMPRCMVRTHLVLAEGNFLAWSVKAVDGWQRGVHLETKQQPLFDGLIVEEQVVSMQMDRRAERALGNADTGDMVDVRVRQQDVCDPDVLARDELEQTVDFVARVDEQSLARACARDDEAVLVERSDRLRLDYDHACDSSNPG